MSEILFVTSNQDKADYLAKMLGVSLAHRKIVLEEIQAPIEDIVEHKVKQAYEITGQPCLVEDVSLAFEALDGLLPGPYIKHYVDLNDGLEKTCRTLDGFESRRAKAECVFGYYDGERLELLRGGLSGEIAKHPRGENGFGWDKIFCPDGFDGKTRAELTPSDDATTYATIKPFAALRELLKSLENGQ